MERRLTTTEKGYVGMGPLRAKKGDFVCVLFGCSVPVILRKTCGEETSYQLIGECYLDGYMSGRAVRGVNTLAALDAIFVAREEWETRRPRRAVCSGLRRG